MATERRRKREKIWCNLNTFKCVFFSTILSVEICIHCGTCILNDRMIKQKGITEIKAKKKRQNIYSKNVSEVSAKDKTNKKLENAHAEATRLSELNETIKYILYSVVPFPLLFIYFFLFICHRRVDGFNWNLFLFSCFLHFYFESTISLVDTVNKDKWRCQWWHGMVKKE